MSSVWWAGVSYAGLTAVMTWPMVVRPSSAYATLLPDFARWLWNIWWMKEALLDLQTSPFFTSYLFHPVGTSLVFHNLSPYHGFVGIPLQLLGADVLATYNLLYLSSFVIGGVGMFLLVREISGNSFPAFIAGGIYAFSPWRFIAYRWTDLWGIQWLPFALLFAIRGVQVPRRRHTVGLAVSLALATLTDWHQPVLLLVTIVPLICSVIFSRAYNAGVRAEVLRHLLWSLVLCGFLTFPLAFLAARDLIAGDTLLYGPMVGGDVFTLVGARIVPGQDLVSYGVLLGWIPIALIIYGTVRGLDFWTRRFAALLVGFFILILGEKLRVPGFVEPLFPLPLSLWREIPLLGILRNSVHFFPMLQVCVAVLAGHGARRLWERMEGRRPGQFQLFRPAFGAGLFILALVEVAQVPWTAIPLRVHPIYKVIQDDGNPGAILDAPIKYTLQRDAARTLWSVYFQTLHHRPLVGGLTLFDGRERLTFIDQNPVMTLFMEVTGESALHPGIMADAEKALRSFLTQHHIRWILLRKGKRDPVCNQHDPRMTGWSWPKFINFVAPSAINPVLSQVVTLQLPQCGEWEAWKAQAVSAVVRRALGPAFYDDEELVVYRVG